MNIVAIIADGLRASDLGVYGTESIATPHLDAWSLECVVFDRHFADTPRVNPLSGISATQDLSWRLDAEAPEELRRSIRDLAGGDRKLLVLRFDGLCPPWPVSDDDLREIFGDDSDSIDVLPVEFIRGEVNNVASLNDDAYAALQTTYTTLVETLDGRFEELLRIMEEERVSASSLVLLTSGRGQHLGEHGFAGVGAPMLHEARVHLPLLMRLPDGSCAGRRVPHITQTSDLVATIADCLGFPRQGDGGASLFPICRGEPGHRTCAGMEYAGERAIQTAHEKLICPVALAGVTSRYYVKPDDRWEVNDLRQKNLDHVEEMEHTLLNEPASGENCNADSEAG